MSDLFDTFKTWFGLGQTEEPKPLDLGSLISGTPAQSSMMSMADGSNYAPAAPSPYQPIENPYDFSGMLQDMAKKTSMQIDGITADQSKLRDDRNALMGFAENDWGSVGAGAIGGIAAALAGGNASDITGGAYATGITYYNNLDAQEKLKIAGVEEQIKQAEARKTDLANFGQSLSAADLAQRGKASDAYITGQIPGTAPREAINQEKKDLLLAELDAKDPIITTPDGRQMRKSDWGREIQERSATAQEKRITAMEQEKLGETAPPDGWGRKPGAPPASKGDADMARKLALEYEPATDAARQFIAALRGQNPNITRADKARLIRNLSGQDIANLGAATNSQEFGKKLPDILATWETTDQPLISIIDQYVRGVNPIETAIRMEENFNKDYEIKMNALHMWRTDPISVKNREIAELKELQAKKNQSQPKG